MGNLVRLFFFGVVLNCGSASAQLSMHPVSDTLHKKVSIRVLPQNFYTHNLSFFCKKEVQLQKLTSLPLFIRAGSKAYVDYLERKPNAVWQPK